MPGLHSAMSRHLFTLNGGVLTVGGAKNLAKGQFTIVKSGSATADGAAVVTSFAGLPDNTSLEMRVGKHKVVAVRTARNAKPYSSENFKVRDVVRVQGNFPKNIDQKFDDFIIGFNGIDADSAIELEEGQTTVMDITLSGGHVEFVTGLKKHTIKVHFGREVGETNQEMIQRVVARLKKEMLPQGVPVTDLISIKPVDSESPALGGDEYVFSTLTLTDDGDSNSLGLVQAQYPGQIVKMTARDGMKSTYTIMRPAGTSLADFKQYTASYPKGCEDCASDYATLASGIVYSVKIEDDGADLTSTIQNIAGFVSGSVKRKGNKEGFGTYTVVVGAELTQTQIDAFRATDATTSTAIVELMGEVTAICSKAATVDTSWVDGDSCFAQVQSYKIQLADDDCDGSRLTELQAAYPGLSIQAGAPSTATQTVTVSTDKELTIVIGGKTYTTADAGTTTQTAAAFVVEHAADILADSGVTVTSATDVVTLVGSAVSFPAVSSADQTVSTVTYGASALAGGCQRTYSTQVATNVVCDECDPIFLESFTSEAPKPFDFVEWELIAPVASETSMMGIRLTGKPFNMKPTEDTRDQIPFYETSTRIQVSGGYAEETSNSFDPIFNDIFKVKRLSRAQDRDNLGWHLLGWEEASRYYFDGEVRKKDNLFAKAVYGQESVLKFDAQYVSYEVTIHDSRYSQSAGQTSDMGTTYVIWAEFGRHKDLENYLNSLAQRAGLTPIQITA